MRPLSLNVMADLNEENLERYKTTFRTWDKVALAYQINFRDIDLYDDTYDTFCRLIQKPGAKILELGCGPGNITKYILGKRPDFEMEAIDISSNMIKLAKENNLTVHFKILDCRNIHTLNDQYDGIMAGFCLPYLAKADVSKLITDCAYLLNKGGILYFSTIEGDYTNSGYETGSQGEDQMYVYYYPEDYLKEKLEINAFDLVDLKRKEYLKSDGTISRYLIFIAKKK